MALPRRLVTSVELDPRVDVAAGRQYGVTALHELELDDGHRIVLLDDRGWYSSLNGPGDVWRHVTRQELEGTARTVVGPDEPPPGLTAEEEAAGHWRTLADTARDQGVDVEATVLAALPHDVEVGPLLGDRLPHAVRRARRTR